MSPSPDLLRCAAFAVGMLALPLASLHGQGLPIQEIETAVRESRPLDKRQQFDDLQSASAYWYESRNPANLPQMDAALKKVLPLALELAPTVKDFATWEDAQLVKPYHYAGMVLLAKAYTLLYYGRVEEAKESVRLIEEKLPYAMFLYTNRTLSWVRENLRYHQHAIALYMAISTKQMGTFAFPPERDEFDGPQQLRAAEDQAILRLREGDYEMVDYFLSMCRKRALRSTTGKWIEDVIYERMSPIVSERHSEGAWDEIGEAIQSWQRVFPKSESARIAEAGYLCNHALYQHWKGRPDSAFRQDIDKAADILSHRPSSSVGWFTLNTRVMICSGRPPEEVMVSVRENLAAHPGHHVPLADFCIMLAAGNEDSVRTCSEFLSLLSEQSDPEVIARVLNSLHKDGFLDRVQSRLDRRAVNNILKTTAQRWNASLCFRNELATLAVDLGARDTASVVMTGMRDHWSHKLWQGREAILKKVLAAVPTAPLTRSLPKVQ